MKIKDDILMYFLYINNNKFKKMFQKDYITLWRSNCPNDLREEFNIFGDRIFYFPNFDKFYKIKNDNIMDLSINNFEIIEPSEDLKQHLLLEIRNILKQNVNEIITKITLEKYYDKVFENQLKPFNIRKLKLEKILK